MEGVQPSCHFQSLYTDMAQPVPQMQGAQAPAQINAPILLPLWSLGVFLLGYLALFAPTYYRLAHTSWASDDQGHGPMIIGASVWLIWSKRHLLFDRVAVPAVGPAFALLVPALLVYALGRSQAVGELEALAQIPVLAAGILLLAGTRGLKLVWFPVVFLIFAVPIPGVLAQAITLPLKMAVSVVAEQVMYWMQYPIGRSGVTLTVGPYQLLVADACSGLNSLFTLESLGLLYMNIMDYKSKTRNFLLAFMIIPISFVSNVIRVITLILLTYHFGDEVGQGFAHSFSGLVLFAVALVLTFGFDQLLAKRFDKQGGARARV